MSNMQQDPSQMPADAADLRKQAEEQAGDKAPLPLFAQVPEVIQQMLYELRVRQVELEKQNAALRTALAESETDRARYFDLYDLAPVACTIISEEGLILEANLTTTSLLGLNRDALANQPISRFILQEDQDIYALHCQKLFETGAPQTCELRLLKSDGSVFWAGLDATAAKDPAGGRVCRVALDDITERKLAEAELLQQKNLLEGVINGMQDVLAIQNPDHTILRYNDAGYKMLNLTHEDIGDKKCFELIGRTAECEPCATRAVLKTGKFQQLQKFVPEMEKYLVCRATPIFDGDGKLIHIVEQLRDITERIKAEEKLRESEEKYRLISEDMPLLICRFLPDYTITYVNKSYCDFFNKSADELLGKSFLTLIPESDHDAVISTIEGLTIDSPANTLEHQVITSDQLFCWQRWTNRALFDEQGNITGYQSIGEDISERKQAEETLRESEERFKTLFSESPVSIIIHDKETGEIVDANKAACRSYGLTSFEELQANTFWTEHPFSADNALQWIHKAATGEIQQFEWKNQKVSGEIFWEHVTLRLVVVGGMERVLSVAIDITDRKQAEETLRKERLRLDNIIKGTHVGTWEWNVQTGETVFNDRWAGIIGYTLEELAPVTIDTWAKHTHPDDLEISEGLLKRHFDGELDYYECEARMKHKRGEWVWVLDRGRVLTWTEDGKPSWMFGTHLDITDRKWAEAKHQQIQKAESLSRMAGAIAHNFNNQLQAVLGHIEIAMDALPTSFPSNKNLSMAMQSGRKAAEISRLMLVYLGQTPDRREHIDLSETCRQSLPLLQAALPNGTNLDADIPVSGPVIHAEAGQLHQILTNLITNAFESILDHQGTISLAVRTVSPEIIPILKRFPIEWQPKSLPYACLEVADTGCGIASMDLEKIFDPFFTTKFTGRGMGLPVVGGIVKAHGGCITVHTKPGSGSTFRVYLPISTEKSLPEPEKAAAVPDQKVNNGATVLLIEDDENVRGMVKALLTHFGYTVIEAQDGVEALEIFQSRQNDICCVLTDLTMPRMGGWETLIALRRIRADVPVILSSGYDKDMVMAGNHPELPQAFLPKPYSMSTLKEALAKALATK